MSGYLPELRFETEYEGGRVSIQLKPLTRLQFINVMPGLQSARKAEDQMALFGTAATVLQESIVKVDGLLDANHRPIEKEEMINTAYFTDLCFRIFHFLLESSVLGKAQKPALEERLLESTEVRVVR